MADECMIGPVSVAKAHLMDNNSYDGASESFEIICTHWQYRQLQGLIEDSYVAQGSMGVTICSGTNPWAPTYINTATDFGYGDDVLIHKGWYILTGLSLSSMENLQLVKCKLTGIKISAYMNEYLTMDYTTGVNDGTSLASTYSTDTIDTVFTDTFASFDTTTKWLPKVANGMASGADITAASNYLVFTGASATANSYGMLATQMRDIFTAPVTIEQNVGFAARPTDTKTYIHRIIVTPKTMIDQATFNQDSIMVEIRVSSTKVSYLAYKNDTKKNVTTIINETVDTAAPASGAYAQKWKIEFDTSKNVKISLDTGSGYNQKYSGPSGLSSVSALHTGYAYYTLSTTSFAMRTNLINITRKGTQKLNNIVVMPAGASLSTSPSFMRSGEDGLIPCYVDPAIPIQFSTSAPYAGSVKAYGNNNPTATYRQLITADEVALPGGFYVSNGLVKLDVQSTNVGFWYWDGTGYTKINQFTIGTINLFKLLEIGPERVTFQINTSKWTLKRGQQYITVKHPNNELTYTNPGMFTHDGTTETLAAGANVSMQTVGHAEAYASGATYGLQIYKLSPTTIKTDSIPASSLTGIGWYNATLPTTDNSSKEKLPLQFPIQTEQHISIKQV